MSNGAEWKSKYKAQREWQKRNQYKMFSFRLYTYQIDRIKREAKERHVSIAKLICDALEAQYQIDFSKRGLSDDTQEFQTSTEE